MKKVVYTVTKESRNGNKSMSGLGYITDKDLITACLSKKGKPYIRIFEDCVKDCHRVINTTSEYKGSYYEIKEIEFETTNSTGQRAKIGTASSQMSILKWFIKYKKLKALFH